MFQQRLRRVAVACVVVALVAAAATLLGRVLHVARLAAPVRGAPPMHLMAAFALVVSCCAVLAHLGGRTRVTFAAGCAVAAFGATIIAEYALGQFPLTSVFPGRVSPPTGAALLCLGSALALQRHPRIATGLTLVAGYIALVALAGYLYGTGLIYELGRVKVSSMALGSGIAIAMLSLSLLFAHPERHPVSVFCGTSTGAFAARRLLLVALAAPTFIGAVVHGVRALGLEDVPLMLALLGASSVPVSLSLVIVHAEALDRTEQARVRVEERLHIVERAARERLESVMSATDAVSAALGALPDADVPTVLKTIVDQAQQLTHARYATIRLLHERDHEAVERRENLVGIAIRCRGRPVGNLYLADKETGEFTVEDIRLAAALADRVGSLIEAARLYQLEALGHSWLQEVIDQLPDGVVVSHASGTVISANRAARGLDVDAHEALSRAVFRREVTSNRELEIKRPDGRVRIVLANATPIWSHDGAFDGAVAVFQDVTELKDLERQREQWISIVAHDLRQPLAVISLAAQMAARHAASSKVTAHALQRIVASCQRLERMTNDLLDASRLEAHRLTVERTAIDLGELVRDIVGRASAVTRGSAVELTIREPLPAVEVDAGRIEQILFNMLSNAAKYGEPGAVIRVAVEEVSGSVEVAVTNRGAGIAPDELPRLFSRFERTRSGRKSRDSIGLGLYITKGLVEAHEGRLWVESKPNEETTFRFSLPISRERGSRPSHAA